MKNKIKNRKNTTSFMELWLVLWKYLRLSKSSLWIIAVCAVISAGTTLFAIYTVGTFMNEIFVALIGDPVTNEKDPKALYSFIFTMCMIGGCYLITFTLHTFQTFILVKISQRTGYEMRFDLFNKLQKVSVSYLDTQSTGDLMSCFTNDIDIIIMTLSQTINQFIMAISILTGSILMMFLINPIFAAISITLAVCFFFLISIFIKKSQPYFTKTVNALGQITSDIEEYSFAHKMISIFGCQEKIMSKFKKNVDIYRETGFKAQIISGLVFPYSNFINNMIISFITALIVVLLIFAPELLETGVIGFSGVAIASVYLLLLRQALSQVSVIISQFNLFQMAAASLRRIHSVVIVEDEPVLNADKELIVENGDIKFNNVDFSYKPGIKVLRDISFEVASHTMTAIVGPTGSGKTTIISLLLAFYNLDSGSIQIDGQDISEFSKDSLRDNVSVVMQDSFIFSGTILENIKYGRLDATDEDVIEAAKLSNADKFISKLNEGYNTHISNDSDILSEGEKQLISIARAFLSKAKIVVLDEATSYVDTKTEKEIQDAMAKLMQTRTSIVIAHRLSTIKDAHNIIVIKDGVQIESGNHDQLMKNKKFYYKLNTAMDQDFDNQGN
ncbi:MAG: ABC transporter ATP-binding protein [Mycoplasma sp.]